MISCQRDKHISTASNQLFDSLESKSTGITFNNSLSFTEEYNPYTFKNFFNGGGVGLGDFNNDNLIDIYFTGNLVDNKLYLNQGDFKFKDITASAGVACKDVWSSGVSLVDINGDNLLDIYVCKSGEPNPKGNRKNELFINQGNLTFVEKASEYGLDFEGLAVHAVFFDFDLDGDLDCYLLNNSIRSVGGYDMIPDQREIPNPEGGNKLLKCMLSESNGTNHKYIDITQEAGIYSSNIGFGLGVSVSDLNEDGWPDIFVSNDFFEKDYLYINNHDGTFSEMVDEAMQELSMGSMGADIADINNDGHQDIFVTEMLPSTLDRTKSKAVFETFEKSQLNYQKGYHRQFGRNALHLNVGINEHQTPIYSELSRYSNTEATEWSWGALIEDFDQDGLKDIFVANGIYKDLLDQDYLNFYNPNQIRKLIQSGEKNAITKMFESMPSSPYPNVFFKNKGALQFQDISSKAGFQEPTFSNGSAYADLDNDGDLDLVTNNIGSTASIYRNNSNKPSYSLMLTGSEFNSQAIGSKIRSFSGDNISVKELYPMKGFESTVDTRILLPISSEKIDSIHIIWPNRNISTLYPQQLFSDSLLVVQQPNVTTTNYKEKIAPNTPLLNKVENIISFQHLKNEYVDFNNNRTQPFFISNSGPTLNVVDINNDGFQDLLIGGSKNQETELYIQKNSKLVKSEITQEANQFGEDTDIMISDLDGNGENDIFIASGSIAFSEASSGLKDKVYLAQDGKFKRADNSFINTGLSSSSAVARIDIDLDGDLDIVVAERLKPKAYGIKGDIITYLNNQGSYNRIAPDGVFKEIGLVTDMKSIDINNDKVNELVVACEYDNIKVLQINENGTWEDISTKLGFIKNKGRWNTIEIVDIDGDGDLDIIASNMGLNNRISNLVGNKAKLYVNDFDRNGSIETILCAQSDQGDIPLPLREDLLMQLPSLKKKVLSYGSYSNSTMQTLFEPNILNQSITYELNEFQTGIFINDLDSFKFVPLPKEAQWTDQHAILVFDINRDGRKDILLGGNQHMAKPELGINAASFGQVFLQNSNGTFIYLPFEKSGLFETGDIRDMAVITINQKDYLLIAKNNSDLVTYLVPKINMK